MGRLLMTIEAPIEVVRERKNYYQAYRIHADGFKAKFGWGRTRDEAIASAKALLRRGVRGKVKSVRYMRK